MSDATTQAAAHHRDTRDATTKPRTQNSESNEESLAAYVLRVRERAYGWPGGISPSRPDPLAPPPRKTEGSAS